MEGNLSPTLTAENNGICRIEKEEAFVERDTAEILRTLRKEIGEKAFFEWAFGGFKCLLAEEILQQNLYAKEIYKDWFERSDIFKFPYNSEDNKQFDFKEEDLRNMWNEWQVRCSSCRCKLQKQQLKQFDDFVQKLSFKTTQKEKCLLDLWKACEGIGLLREALSKVQEIWQSTNGWEMQRNYYRIRKLTAKETWRLMGFTDNDFRKAEAVNSNTQLYKQAGNSIVKDVLMAIFEQMM